jgi:RNA-directed DNA polymerase
MQELPNNGTKVFQKGSCVRPVLANILAHQVIDMWFEAVVKRHCAGQVALYQYADDAVICCQYTRDAECILRALRQRLAKYGLRLNDEKTRLKIPLRMADNTVQG